MKIRNVEKIVKTLLTDIPVTRDDDFLLIKAVYERIDWKISFYNLGYVLLNHDKLGLPSTETITRARRKLQAENESLRGTKYIQKLRRIKEDEIRDYVKKDTNR